MGTQTHGGNQLQGEHSLHLKPCPKPLRCPALAWGRGHQHQTLLMQEHTSWQPNTPDGALLQRDPNPLFHELPGRNCTLETTSGFALATSSQGHVCLLFFLLFKKPGIQGPCVYTTVSLPTPDQRFQGQCLPACTDVGPHNVTTSFSGSSD